MIISYQFSIFDAKIFFTSVHFSLWCTARLVSLYFDLLLFSAIETYTESRISPAWLWLVKNYVTWYFLTNQDHQQATGAADLPPSSAVQCRPPGDFLKIIKKVDKWKYFECLRFFKVRITKALVWQEWKKQRSTMKGKTSYRCFEIW